MTNYDGMPLPADTLYLDFGAAEGDEWKNRLGTMKVVSRNATVQGKKKTYDRGVTIHQSGGDLYTTYAPGVGFVKFGNGPDAFVLDEDASTLVAASLDPLPGPTRDSAPASLPSITPSAPAAHSGPLPRLGIIPTVFANEPATSDNRMKRYRQTLEAGITFMACYGKWNELEPRDGEYNFDSLRFQVSLAEKHDYPLSYTLQIVDTVDRTVPSYLEQKSWSGKKLHSRVLRLTEAIAPVFKGRVKWFMFGNEVDSYFLNHRDELSDFADLYKAVAARLRKLAPGVQISTTLQFTGLDHLDDILKPLDRQSDFLALTYGPYNPDWSVQNPSVVSRDFEMMKSRARGRKILLQEIAYPSSTLNRSSEEKQAEFYQNVFVELRRHGDLIEAASFMYLADLPEESSSALAAYYGADESTSFKMLLQTLGMFDGQGRPKKSWHVFTREVQRH
jgi:hypothetical protein